MEKDYLNKATSDRALVKEWLTNGDNIGLVCAKSGLVVVDVDVKHGGIDAWAALCMEHGEPITRTHLTPSGGKHYIFLATQGKRYKGMIQKGIDIRYNAQIVVPPSTIGTKAYSKLNSVDYMPVPEWLDALMVKQSLKTERQKVSASYLIDLAKEIKKYDLSYEEWTQVGMAIHSADDTNQGLDAFIEASLGPSYQEGDEDKCADKWASFSHSKDDAITIKTLVHLIRSKGGVVPNTASKDDFEAITGQQRGWIEEDGKFITHSKLDCIEHFNKTHSFYMEGGEACVIRNEDVRTMKLKTFYSQFPQYVFRYNRGKKTFEEAAAFIWAEDGRRREIDRIIFAPTCSDREINLFTGMPKFELELGEPSSILHLLSQSLVPNDDERNWLLDWLAHILQRPFEKSSLVPVHITPEGTGKGIFYEMAMQRILDKYFVKVDKCAHLSTNFNKHLANKFLTFIDESTWGGRKDEASTIKSLTGSEKLTIEEKFGATFSVANLSRYVIASNDADAVNIAIGNRRFVILKSSDKYAANTSFHHPIADMIRNTNEVDKFGSYLLKRDISKFRPHEMPDFRNGEDTKFSSMGAVGAFWQEVIMGSDIHLWTEKGLPQKSTYQAFDKWKREVNHWEKCVTKQLFWKTTKKMINRKMEPEKKRVGADVLVYFSIKPHQFFNGMLEALKINIPLQKEEDYYANQEDF